jgi:N-acetylgalactosamine-N,N'-diacetylbacillosaminyl-diphospho-undecaprenol 4-alpha-N-acetylgalactosaminyltransferase
MKKKVAVFINSLRGGGAERIVSYILQEGCDEYEFHLILLEEVIEYEIPADQIHLYILEKKVSPAIISMLKLPLLARKLRSYLDKHEITTMLSLLNRPNLIACKVKADGWKGNVIISERADTLAYYKTRKLGSFMIRLVKKYYKKADHVTAISSGIADSLKILDVPEVKVIYNPIHISTEFSRVGKSEGPFTFINVARFDEQKNHRLLLEAFSMLEEKNCRLWLLGKGKLEKNLREYAAALGISDRVEFLGFKKNVNEYLLQSDCFVFSSDFEGLGNVIIEALNNGLPVISTDCPHGPREIIDPTTRGKIITDKIDTGEFGILVPVKRADLLAEAMKRIMDDYELRNKYSNAARERAKDFDIKKIVHKYFELF